MGFDLGGNIAGRAIGHMAVGPGSVLSLGGAAGIKPGRLHQQGERLIGVFAAPDRGFGSFEVREYKAYEGRNPRTGEPVHVRPKRLPFFKVGKELKERVNQSFQEELSPTSSPSGGAVNDRGW